MDFRTLWYGVISTLQAHHPKLRISRISPNLDRLRVEKRRRPYDWYSVMITIGSNKKTAEIRVLANSHSKVGSQAYSFTPGNLNEIPRPIPDLSGVMCATEHITTIDADSPGRIHEGIASWIEEIISADEAKRDAENASEKDPEEEMERREKLKMAGASGDQAAFDEIIGELCYGLHAHYIDWLTLMSERGNARAQLALGRHLCDRLIFAGDEMQPGLNWLRKAADQGCPESAYELCSQHYPDFSGTEPDVYEEGDEYYHGTAEHSWSQVWHWLEVAVNRGHPKARFDLAMFNLENDHKLPTHLRQSRDFCIDELRELASAGLTDAVLALSLECARTQAESTRPSEGDGMHGGTFVKKSEYVEMDERISWVAHGSGLGIRKLQCRFADHLLEGHGISADRDLGLRWLFRAYASRHEHGPGSQELTNEVLGKIIGQHFDAKDMPTLGLIRAIDGLKRYDHSEYHEPAWHPYHIRRFAVTRRAGHLLVDGYILDTGSPFSPTLDELDSRFPGIRDYIHQHIGTEIRGIFGNDRIMSGSGFILDMRQGDEGTLWILNAPRDFWKSEPSSSISTRRLPCLSIDSESIRGGPHNGHYVADWSSNMTTRAYLDTGAQYSFLRFPIENGRKAEDFTVAGNRFETFMTRLEKVTFSNAQLKRICQVGNLPPHLSEPVFKGAQADLILGSEFLHGAIVCWRRRDNLLHVQEGAHVSLAEPLIGTELNAESVRAPSHFESYHLGTRDYGPDSFEKDLEQVVPMGMRVQRDDVWSAPLNIIEFETGGRADFLTGRRRTMFIMSCYFKVLVDQVFHHHYNDHHACFERLDSTLKLTLLGGNLDPNQLLHNTVRDDPAASAAFVQARTFFEVHIKEQVRTHFPALSPDEVWNTVNSYLPTQYPYFS